MSYPIKSPRKLIEVALPLDAINEASAREKSIRHGHPSTLHLWWARRPLAAARAVIFAQLVNDPGTNIGSGFRYGMEKKKAAIERKRLFKIIEDLVQWENTTNEEVLERARVEIRRSWREVCELNKDHPQAVELFNPEKLPALHDPFAGGGAIPLEAQRLGLESYASDLNPVAVLINKAMIEIPPKFARRSPIHPADKNLLANINAQRTWPGATGLAEDVRYYGNWMLKEAHNRIGNLYPPIEITTEIAKGREDLNSILGQKLTVIAWIWVRTIKSPNPAFSHVDVPLASTFILSSKAGKEAYIQPVVTGDKYHFVVQIGVPPPGAAEGTKVGRGGNFKCLISGVPISVQSIRKEGKAGHLSFRLMAVVAEGPNRRVYLPPSEESERVVKLSAPNWIPDLLINNNPRDIRCQLYGLTRYGDLFNPRQLVAMNTFCDLVTEARGKAYKDAIDAGRQDDKIGIEAGGTSATAYAEAISVYLAFVVDRLADYYTTLGRWQNSNQQLSNLFGRQAVAMTWDYPEANPFSGKGGSFENLFDWTIQSIENIGFWGNGFAQQADAQTQIISKNKAISSDPPYYDNIGYADLSDFFYVWLRKNLKSVFPQLLSTIAVPKAEELVATPYRHGGNDAAEKFFLNGMTSAMGSLAKNAHPEIPITIYYAFKQSETEEDTGTASTGWETFLEAVCNSGLQITGTWPLRTEMSQRMIADGTNALASSIVLVCRKRPPEAQTISRRELQRELNVVLPVALDEMTKGSGDELSPVAPVDLSQAIIGPGMAVFSKYAAVLEADGKPMSVRTALQLINRFLGEDDFDHDTQFCLHWFEQHGWNESVFGEADTLARAKGTSVDGVKEAGVIQSGGGKVRLLKWSEYPEDWDPRTDKRMPVWEALHHLIRAFRQGGDSASGALLAALGGKAEAVRQLAYRLYTLCERLGQSEDARAYNELITSWTGIESAAAAAPKPGEQDLPGADNWPTNKK
jgi:putative DNA methylase